MKVKVISMKFISMKFDESHFDEIHFDEIHLEEIHFDEIDLKLIYNPILKFRDWQSSARACYQNFIKIL